MRFHVEIIALEIVGVEEEEDASAGLVPDGGTLFRGIRFGEHEGCFASARADEDPAISVLWGVFDQFEMQSIGEEFDGFIVIADEIGDVSEGVFHGI